MEGYRILDLGTTEGRAESARYEAEKAEKVRSGQQLYAKIKRSSKYYGQGEKGELFEVFVGAGYPKAYLVQGGPGGHRRVPAGHAHHRSGRDHPRQGRVHQLGRKHAPQHPAQPAQGRERSHRVARRPDAQDQP